MNRREMSGLTYTIEDKEGERKFLINNMLGYGGEAFVYGAVEQVGQNVTQKEVALRFLSSETDSEDLRKEGERAISFRHENVLRTFWYGMGRVATKNAHIEMPAMLTELAWNGSLTNRMNKKFPSEGESMSLLEQAMEGVRYAHEEHNTLHRDIKPSNLLLFGDRLKVTDFGIAARVQATITESALGIAGTHPYMAPEVFEKAEKSTIQSDIYSMGVLIYELLSKGRTPLGLPKKSSFIEYYNAHKNNVLPRPLSVILGSASTRAVEFAYEEVEKALSKKPEQRHRSIGDLKENLRTRYERGKAVDERSPTIIDLGSNIDPTPDLPTLDPTRHVETQNYTSIDNSEKDTSRTPMEKNKVNPIQKREKRSEDNKDKAIKEAIKSPGCMSILALSAITAYALYAGSLEEYPPDFKDKVVNYHTGYKFELAEGVTAEATDKLSPEWTMPFVSWENIRYKNSFRLSSKEGDCGKFEVVAPKTEKEALKTYKEIFKYCPNSMIPSDVLKEIKKDPPKEHIDIWDFSN